MAYALKLSDVEMMRYRMMAEQARANEADLWELAGIRAGASIADIGCGPGMVLAKLAEIVGPTGQVVGVDGDPDAVATARTMLDGVAGASVRQGSADATGLDAASFDVVVMRHVLAHNGGSEQAIVDHLASLVRPGGCIYLVDIHGAGMAIHPRLGMFDEMVAAYGSFMAGRGNDFSVGLRLGELLTEAGLEVDAHRGSYSIVSVPPGMRPPAWAARDAMLADGIVTQSDLTCWEAELLELDQMPRRPTLFSPVFIAVGRRPLAPDA